MCNIIVLSPSVCADQRGHQEDKLVINWLITIISQSYVFDVAITHV